MTDNEIIKALEWNISKFGEEVCFGYMDKDGCKKVDAKDILDIINRKKAEIERLKTEEEKYPFKCVMPFNSMICSKSIDDYDRLIDDIEAEAIKEFAERLKEQSDSHFDYSELVFEIGEEKIDNLVKEMEGEDK